MSGKRARWIRKKNFSSKKILAICAGLYVSSMPIAAESELLATVFGSATKPFGEAHHMQYGMGGGLKVTYRPVQFLNIFAQGQYLSMDMPGIEPIKVMDAQLGTGYHLVLSDRTGLDFNVSGGAYKAKSSSSSINGFTAGASLVFTYKISPVVSVDLSASGTHYASGTSPLMMVNAAASPGITFNLTQLFNKTAKIDMQLNELAPVFPALYSWYEKNSFGKVILTNNEETAITDITVSFFQPQYMAHAKECATIRKIEKGESAEVDLIAFFNEQMLELTERSDTNSIVIVNYMRLGQKRSKSFPLDVPVYGRNNMSWDDDRRAAVFVSSKDPAAMHFAKYVTSIVREKKRASIPVNIQYAMGIFEALNEFGINYVVDPSSAFEDNVGTASIDFLQFPYQTLMYKGGDCDDLSILVCSLFEAVGIRTAFITIPGHIFMAFDSGMTVEEADEKLRSLGNYIEIENEVWIPLEITLSDEGFYKAYKYGAREWNKAFADGTAAIYRMQDSWKIYPPISVPGAAAKFTMPASKQISISFEKSVDQWCFGELRDMLDLKPVKLAVINQESEETETVIKEDPLAPESLYEVLSLSGQSFAMLTTSGIKEKRNSDEEEDDESGDELEPDEDEEIDEPIEPLIAVNVPGPEELGLVVPVSEKKFVTKFEEKQGTSEAVLAKAEQKADTGRAAVAEKTEQKTDAVRVAVAEKTAEVEKTDVTESISVAEKTTVGENPAVAENPAVTENSSVAEKTAAAEKTSEPNVTAAVEASVEPVEAVVKVEEAFVEDTSSAAEKAESSEPAVNVNVDEAVAVAAVTESAPVVEKTSASEKSDNKAAIIAISAAAVAMSAAAGIYISKKKKEEGNK